MSESNGGKLASNELKMEAASEIGLADKIKSQGWESLTTKEVGNIVRQMIKKGQDNLAGK